MRKSSFLKTALVTSMALLTIPAALMYTEYAISIQPEAEQSEEAVTLPAVTVIPVMAGTQQASIQLYGEVRAVDEISFSSQISGRVIWRNPGFNDGQLVNKDDILLRLDPVDYQVAVTLAEQELADAALALKQEKRESAQALKDWQRAGLKETPSDLLLRKPQLRAVRARYRAAEANLKKARHDLSLTELKAPFSAVVQNRAVSAGSYIDSGVELARLSASDQAEVRVALSDQQWALLDKNLNNVQVQLKPAIQNSETPALTEQENTHWQGKVDRADRFLNRQTRLRELVVTVDHPLTQNPPLLTGRFVSVELPGRQLSDLLAIPVSSLTADNYIWYLKGDTLQRQKVTPVFSDQGHFYLPGHQLPEQIQLVRKPMSNYLPGMKVVAVTEGQNHG